MNLKEEIITQKEKIEKGNPKIELASSCRIGHGIDTLNEEESKQAIRFYENKCNALDISFFIPASGSGSRMFGAAYDFISNQNPGEDTIEFIEQLVNRIKQFAFYDKLPQATKNELRTGDIDIEAFLKLVLHEEGFNFGNRPKGLIPFHRYGNFIINPFQEHILQGTSIGGDKSRFHFTINARFEDEIKHSIKILREITGINFDFDFSVQDDRTNSIAFDTEGNVFYDENDTPITRPSGHGALIENLNKIEADLILIRNIDNVQHQDHAENSGNSRKMLSGVLLDFQTTVFEILLAIDNAETYLPLLQKINHKYMLNLSEELMDNPVEIKAILNRPSRICGMVRNEGQPGGGPFWVQDKNGNQTKQIVEKSQISTKSSQLAVMIKSTHFNPVEIICAPKDYKGNKFDLLQFRDDSQYFIVHKNQKGIPVQFIEQPGLWNGGMANWNTLFFEIDNACFSPVKTVLDLLKPLHNEKR